MLECEKAWEKKEEVLHSFTSLQKCEETLWKKDILHTFTSPQKCEETL